MVNEVLCPVLAMNQVSEEQCLNLFKGATASLVTGLIVIIVELVLIVPILYGGYKELRDGKKNGGSKSVVVT